jgi:hypothetical protein
MSTAKAAGLVASDATNGLNLGGQISARLTNVVGLIQFSQTNA